MIRKERLHRGYRCLGALRVENPPVGQSSPLKREDMLIKYEVKENVYEEILVIKRGTGTSVVGYKDGQRSCKVSEYRETRDDGHKYEAICPSDIREGKFECYSPAANQIYYGRTIPKEEWSSIKKKLANDRCPEPINFW